MADIINIPTGNINGVISELISDLRKGKGNHVVIAWINDDEKNTVKGIMKSDNSFVINGMLIDMLFNAYIESQPNGENGNFT